MIRQITLPKWTERFPEKNELYLSFLVSVALGKMQDYRKELEVFESKYKTTFEDFEKKVLQNKKEDFQKWDDYIIWKGYFLAYDKWAKRYKESIRCLR